MTIQTETKDPKAPSEDKDKKGKLFRDEQGRWKLIKEEKQISETEKQINRVTSLDQRVIANVIAQSAITLARAGVQSSRLDAELLMMHVLEVKKEQLVKKWTNKLKDEEYDKYQKVLNRRLKREPLAYIVGSKEFMGLKFMVDNRVLVPRPESELLVETVLHFLKQWEQSTEQLGLVDVGTGCGNIALSIAKEVNFVKIFAIDTSSEALDVARINAQLLGLDQNVAFLHGDLLSPLPQPVHLIVANLPYISGEKYKGLEPEICNFEPKEALLAGADGLDVYRRLLAQTPQFLLKNGKVIMEVDPEQIATLRTIVLQHLPGANIEISKDLQGLDRVVIVHA